MKAMPHLEAGGAAPLDRREGLFVPGERHRQRLAGMPGDIEAGAEYRAVEDAVAERPSVSRLILARDCGGTDSSTTDR